MHKAVMELSELNINNSSSEPVDINSELTDAGFIRRITAFLIDSILLFLFILFLLSYFFEYFSVMKLLSGWAFSFSIFMIFFFYQIILLISESVWSGKTPGKFMLNICVKKADGKDAEFFQVLTRNLLRCTYFIPPVFILPDLISFIASGKRLGDLLAGTRVVKLK